MADIDFPADIPAPKMGSFKEGLLETKVEDSGEVGSPRRRNRFTRALMRFSFSLALTDDQKATLDDFYLTTLDRGVEHFNWTHPVDGKVYEVAMSGMPNPSHVVTNLWAVSVKIEEI